MKLIHFKFILILLSSFLFAQNQPSSKDKEFSNLVYELSDLIENTYSNTISSYKKNNKLPINSTRKFFYEILEIDDQLMKYSDETSLIFINNEGVISELNSIEIQSFLYNFKYYVMQEFFYPVLDYLDEKPPSKEDIDVRDIYIKFLSDMLIFSFKIKESDWKSDMVRDESILSYNKGRNSDFFVHHDWLSSQMFTTGIYKLSKHASDPMNVYIGELEISEKIIQSLQRYGNEVDKFTDLQLIDDYLEIYYNSYISALDNILTTKYYFEDSETGKDIFSCISCDINEYQRAFGGENWFIWTEMLYFNELISLTINSQNGYKYQNKKGTKETLKSLEGIISEIENIITPGYRYPLGSDFDIEIQSELIEKGYPEVSYDKSLASTNDEFVQDLKFDLFGVYIASMQIYIDGGYDKDAYLLFENAQNIFYEFDYEFIKKNSIERPERFERLYSDIGQFKLNYFMLGIMGIKNQELDQNQIGIPKEFSSSLQNDYSYFNSQLHNFTQIADSHNFEDKTLIKEFEIMDNFVDWTRDLITNPPLFFDVAKAEKEILHITRTYGKEASRSFTYEVLIGMISNQSFVFINEESLVKKFKEKIATDPSIKNIDTYINYYFYKEITKIVVREYELTQDNTQEDLIRIMSSKEYANILVDKFEEEIYANMREIMNDELLENMVWDSIRTIRIKDIQKEPELFSNTFRVLKNLVLLNSKYQEFTEEKALNALISQIMLLSKIDTVLEFETEDSNDLLVDYFEVSDKEIDNFKINIYSTVVELGVPIVQTVFLEEFGIIDLINATYIITESEGTYSIQKAMFLHDTSKQFLSNFNTNINLLNKSLSKNLDSTDLQKQVYSALISPILNLNLFNHNGEDLMPIIFITNATTQSIPFTALIDENDNYLLDSFVFIRSNSLLKLMNAKKETLWKKEKPLLIAGNIDYKNNKEYSTKRINDYGELNNLKWSRNELDMINEIETNSIIKSNISETDFKNIDFKMYGALHFSVHGKSIFEDPSKSALFLGSDNKNDGILTVDEIRQLDLSKIDFVFLSACETNTGKRYSNLNPITLQTAFHQAGVNSTISTLWSIDDKATTYFSEIFYLMSEETEFRFLALHRAKQLFIIKYPEYKNPYYWAAFTLDGF